MSNRPKGEFHMIGKEKNLKENIVSIRCSLSKVHVYPPEQIHDKQGICFLGSAGTIDFYRVFTSNINIDKQARAQLFKDPIKVASQHAK